MKEHDSRIFQCGWSTEFAVRSSGRNGAETQGRRLARREWLMTSVARENSVKMKTEERSQHLMIRKSYQRASEVGDWSRNGCKQRH